MRGGWARFTFVGSHDFCDVRFIRVSNALRHYANVQRSNGEFRCLRLCVNRDQAGNKLSPRCIEVRGGQGGGRYSAGRFHFVRYRPHIASLTAWTW